jgi:uncharacterized protein YlzI (FlbEa/FlbD family)
MTILQLTGFDGTALWLNMALVEQLMTLSSPNNAGTALIMASGRTLHVRESLSAILDLTKPEPRPKTRARSQ